MKNCESQIPSVQCGKILDGYDLELGPLDHSVIVV